MYSKKQAVRQIFAKSFMFCWTVVFLFGSCQVSVKPNFIVDDKQLAQQQIDSLHKRFNLGDFEAIYTRGAPGLQQAMSKKQFFSFLDSIRAGLGDFQTIIDKRINIIIGTPVQFRAVCNSQYDKGVLTEMFIFLKDHDEIQLAQYTISIGESKLPGIDSN